jgi:hypothetical protein
VLRARSTLCAVILGVLVLGLAACDPRSTPSPNGTSGRGCRGWSATDVPAGPSPSDTPEASRRSAGVRKADRCLRINQIQVIGSHNSYHIEPQEPVATALGSFDAALLASLEYTHSPLPAQFDDERVRQIELDVFADPLGGHYDQRNLLPVLGLPADSGEPELERPGFKVLHVQEIDFLSTCLTFRRCLEQVKAWSDAHPGHLPIAVLVELKDGPIPDPLGVFVQPLPIGPAELDALDAEIRSVFDERRIITPDDVRGTTATLEEAVLASGWPTLGEARGTVMFLMDNGGQKRLDYLAGHPSLTDRVLFTSSSPGQPDAAFVKRNDPLGGSGTSIAELVRRGYIVRTRADADTVQARTGDTTQRDAALASGAQWVSTDYPVPGRSARFGTEYVAELPGEHVARCNQVNTGPRCRDRALERLR